MYFADRVTLIRRAGRADAQGKPVKDEVGNQVFDETETVVWAEVSSPTRAEVASAGAQGLVPSATVKVHTDDYAGQTIVVVNGQRLVVYRAYRPNHEVVELYATEKRGDSHGGH